MKRFFAAYESVLTDQRLVFSVLVHDERVGCDVLRMVRDQYPRLRWTEKDGLLGKAGPPCAPFDFLPSAVKS